MRDINNLGKASGGAFRACMGISSIVERRTLDPKVSGTSPLSPTIPPRHTKPINVHNNNNASLFKDGCSLRKQPWGQNAVKRDLHNT